MSYPAIMQAMTAHRLVNAQAQERDGEAVRQLRRCRVAADMGVSEQECADAGIDVRLLPFVELVWPDQLPDPGRSDPAPVCGELCVK